MIENRAYSVELLIYTNSTSFQTYFVNIFEKRFMSKQTNKEIFGSYRFYQNAT